MPQINEITDVMNVPMDESNTSNSYQISSSTSEQVQTQSRAVHVRKTNSKTPIPKGASSHRGPGSVVSNQSGAITPVGSREGAPEPSVVGVSQAYGLSLHDQRPLPQSSTTNVLYDQRSLHQQVKVGIDPSVAASAIAHAQVVESQAIIKGSMRFKEKPANMLSKLNNRHCNMFKGSTPKLNMPLMLRVHMQKGLK